MHESKTSPRSIMRLRQQMLAYLLCNAPANPARKLAIPSPVLKLTFQAFSSLTPTITSSGTEKPTMSDLLNKKNVSGVMIGLKIGGIWIRGPSGVLEMTSGSERTHKETFAAWTLYFDVDSVLVTWSY